MHLSRITTKIAQTIVNLGIEFEHIISAGNLKGFPGQIAGKQLDGELKMINRL